MPSTLGALFIKLEIIWSEDMSTLKDVAEIAGVSVSTVSYVLSGKKTVRPETLKRIQDAIKQVDYCPNFWPAV